MLELGTFPVDRVIFGAETRWHDGTLEIDRDELLDLVRQDERIPWTDIDVVQPGDSVRIINDYEIIEPRVEEILSLARQEMEKAEQLERMPSGIVLTVFGPISVST